MLTLLPLGEAGLAAAEIFQGINAALIGRDVHCVGVPTAPESLLVTYGRIVEAGIT